MPVKIRSENPFCVPSFGSSQAVITRDLVNGGNMQSDRRLSSCGSGACQADSRAQHCRAASLLPSPATASPALLRLLAAQSPCREPRTAGTGTPVTANTSNPLSNKAWLHRTCYSIILCGLLVWNTQLPQIRNLLPHGICFILFL